MVCQITESFLLKFLVGLFVEFFVSRKNTHTTLHLFIKSLQGGTQKHGSSKKRWRICRCFRLHSSATEILIVRKGADPIGRGLLPVQVGLFDGLQEEWGLEPLSEISGIWKMWFLLRWYSIQECGWSNPIWSHLLGWLWGTTILGNPPYESLESRQKVNKINSLNHSLGVSAVRDWKVNSFWPPGAPKNEEIAISAW